VGSLKRTYGRLKPPSHTSKTIPPMKTRSFRSAPPFPAVSEDDIRDFAYHLYVQSGCQPGHDVENWLEAKACLGDCVPPSQSHLRLHRHLEKGSAPRAPVAKVSAA
jgi:hypothetical protein